MGQVLLIGTGIVLAAFGGVAWALSKSKASMESDPAELGAEARWLLRPIRELRNSLAETATKTPDMTTKVIAQEAVSEADEILRKATEMVAVRERLKTGLKGQGEAETHLGRIQRDIATATSDAERDALQTALQARQTEIVAYATAKSKIAEIDGRLKLAEATLAELRARLSTSGVTASPTGHEAEFTDMVQRLRTLGTSFDEAQEFVQDQNL